MRDTKEVWVNITREDFVTGTEIWLHIGKTDQQLFIQMGVGYDTQRLEILDLVDLKNLPKDGKTLFSSISGEKDGDSWFAEASFHVESGKVRAVELSVKSCSDEDPTIKRVELKVDKKIEKEAINDVLVEEEDTEEAEYQLPPRVAEGPTYPVDQEKDASPGDNKSESVTEGEGFLKFIPQEGLRANQSEIKAGVFQTFYNEFLVVNTSPKTLPLVKLTADLKTPGSEEWRPLTVNVGTKSGHWDYRWRNESSFMNVPSTESLKHALRYTLELPNMKVSNSTRRAHKSLPTPLQIRVVATDQDGKQNTIVMTYNNPPLGLPNKTKREEYNKKEYIYWGFCDDLESEFRAYVEVAKLKESYGKCREYLEIRAAESSYVWNLYESDLKKFAFQATRRKN
eukprot:TRINITY_DN2121_c0_g1_i1.p1 TRINITY_DN2121_c0_g1~~TRINITY_DN2121_c0_g1_i1.p1  ORF type:complete len:397 (-),score=121.86 TRINITY_DN2121_c0_g1_i1:195-1385(-)